MYQNLRAATADNGGQIPTGIQVEMPRLSPWIRSFCRVIVSTNNLDMAIEGEGFLLLNNNREIYTRAGPSGWIRRVYC
jgi:flagellar hook protein FlgE